MRKIFKVFYNTILALLGILIILVGATLIPIPGNFKVYIVESGSMEPAVKTGSLIFVKPEKNYSVGNIVTIKNGKNTVTHRIININIAGQNITTKGDANEEEDAEKISSENIVGKMIFTLPYIGYPVGYAKTRVGFMFLVIIPAVIIVYDELHRIKREAVKSWQGRKKKGAFQKNDYFEGKFARPSLEDNVGSVIFESKENSLKERPKSGRRMDL